MDNIEREIRIDILIDNPNRLVDEFNLLWNRLLVTNCHIYDWSETILFYTKDTSKWIFLYSISDSSMFCNCENYWNLFSENDYYNTYLHSLTKVMLEDKLPGILIESISIIFDINSDPIKNFIKRINE